MIGNRIWLLMGLCGAALINVEASRALQTTPTYACGKSGSFCGASLPTGVNCPKGPGYCEPGLFCGWNFSDTDKTTRCMPVPTDCGKAGKPCCPGNAGAPVTDPKAPTPPPTCSDGSYCIYTPTPGGSGWDSPPYSSPANALLGQCFKVAKDCGTAAGKPCCPSMYHQRINPALPTNMQNPTSDLCSTTGNLFCQYGSGASPTVPAWATGTCQPNKLDCGKFGKSCCIFTSGVSTNANCGAAWNEVGAKGYCSYPSGKPTGDMRDQICKQCPDKSVVVADPFKYFGCPQF